MNRIFIINPKGGSGKSTMAIHTAVGFLNLGYKVLFIDCDIDQLTGYNFFQHRKIFMEQKPEYPVPMAHCLKLNVDQLESVIAKEGKNYDFIIVDTPGMTLHHHNQMIIQWADTIICPLNESFIDLEAFKDSLFFNQLCLLKNKPVADSNHQRTVLLVTTRRSPIASYHQEDFYKELHGLKKFYGLDFIKGFFESVSFKEMFRNGLTTLDCSALHIIPSNIQRKSIESIKFYIKYLVQKILTNQYMFSGD
jgi:chromosome partitioning protein